ncbi:MAG: lipoate--protein ligase family protein [Nitrospirae bacterium]|nr:lipoate--protein ligase family protein [Nitrospirota bacterium]
MMNYFRVISSKPQNPFENMALDEAIFKEVSAGNSPPTLRFYTWEYPSVSIGYFQNPKTDLYLDQLKTKKIPWVRRITGGRGIFHSEELTYSLSAPVSLTFLSPKSIGQSHPETSEPFFPNSIKGTYHKISLGFLKGFQRLGLPVHLYASPSENRSLAEIKKNRSNPLCFSTPSWFETMIEKKKVVGSAQKRFKNGFLQQGSILLNHRFEDFKDYFQLLPEDLHEFVGIFDFLQKEIPLPVLEAELISGMEEAWGIQFKREEPTQRETALCNDLTKQKYGKNSWNFDRIF